MPRRHNCGIFFRDSDKVPYNIINNYFSIGVVSWSWLCLYLCLCYMTYNMIVGSFCLGFCQIQIVWFQWNSTNLKIFINICNVCLFSPPQSPELTRIGDKSLLASTTPPDHSLDYSNWHFTINCLWMLQIDITHILLWIFGQKLIYWNYKSHSRTLQFVASFMRNGRKTHKSSTTEWRISSGKILHWNLLSLQVCYFSNTNKTHSKAFVSKILLPKGMKFLWGKCCETTIFCCPWEKLRS